MPLWIWPLYHKHNATFVSLLTLGNIYPFRCWRTLRHFFIAVQMRSNCGRTMHIRCSLFRPSILFLSLFIANFLSSCVIHSVNFSLFLSRKSVSSEIPLRKNVFLTAQFHNIRLYHFEVQRHAEEHSVIFIQFSVLLDASQ